MRTDRSRKGLFAIGMAAVLAVAACGAGASPSPSAAPTDAPSAAPTDAATPAPTDAATPAPTDAAFQPSCDVTGKTIAWVGVLKGNPTVQLMIQGVLDEANRLGMVPQVVSPDDADWTKGASLGMQAIATGLTAIVTPILDPALYGMVEEAGKKGIPVVGTHILTIEEGKVPGLLGLVGFDAAAWAGEAAELIGERIGGTGTVAVTQGSFNDTENAVTEAFTKAMAAKYPNVKVLAAQEEGFDPPAAIAKAVAILQANPDVVAAISTTGGGPTTWAGAQDETGRALITVGPDYNKPNLDLAKAGKLTAIGAQPIYEEHVKAVQLAAEALCGKTVPYLTELPAPVVTGSELDPYFALLAKIEAAATPAP